MRSWQRDSGRSDSLLLVPLESKKILCFRRENIFNVTFFHFNSYSTIADIRDKNYEFI